MPVNQSQYTHAEQFITEFNRRGEEQIQSCVSVSTVRDADNADAAI